MLDRGHEREPGLASDLRVGSCGAAVDSNYSIGYIGGTVTVDPAPLTITASSQTMTYGSTPAVVTPLYVGFVNGDNASSLSTPPNCSTTATSASAPSTYPSTCTGAVDSNYTIAYVAGSVAVNPIPITIAVSGSQTNGGSPSFAGMVSPPAGVGVDTSSLTCSEVTPATPISGTLPNGTYTLVAGSCQGCRCRAPMPPTTSSSRSALRGTSP